MQTIIINTDIGFEHSLPVCSKIKVISPNTHNVFPANMALKPVVGQCPASLRELVLEILLMFLFCLIGCCWVCNVWGEGVMIGLGFFLGFYFLFILLLFFYVFVVFFFGGGGGGGEISGFFGVFFLSLFVCFGWLVVLGFFGGRLRDRSGFVCFWIIIIFLI